MYMCVFVCVCPLRMSRIYWFRIYSFLSASIFSLMDFQVNFITVKSEHYTLHHIHMSETFPQVILLKLIVTFHLVCFAVIHNILYIIINYKRVLLWKHREITKQNDIDDQVSTAPLAYCCFTAFQLKTKIDFASLSKVSRIKGQIGSCFSVHLLFSLV